ncbi:uncharacterized protein PIG-Wb [Drosophila tropicalis]|uniref:uncharacterized protein PIG-Wb n=1 Tax=Drosophila tropicalis TaxID=46794 RepID=UPI0035ABC0B5
MLVLSGCFIFGSKALKRAQSRVHFDLGGNRPTMFTLVRALTHLITAICILAIDFTSFYRPYRKTRRFGAQLMDTGIGLFVITMGLVSRRSTNNAELQRQLFYSMPLLLLGLARTVSIVMIGYSQDEHEYGQHLNAFFTLGLAKLFGSLLSRLARKDIQLLPMAISLLVVHQLGLSLGLSDYVMNDDLSRSTFWAANREGLISLPGFVAIYLLSIYFSRWLLVSSNSTLLTYTQMVNKLKRLLYLVIINWIAVICSAYLFGISRVTCNFGYVIWIFSIMSTMLWLSLFAGDFIINSVLPLDTMRLTDANDAEEQGVLLSNAKTKATGNEAFIICQSLNMNGLVYFILANVLTGGVNIFFEPEARSDEASVLILLIYMLLATKFVHSLYIRGMRLA